MVSCGELRRWLVEVLGTVGGRLSGGMLVSGACWDGEVVEGEREREAGEGGGVREGVKLTSDRFASLEAWISAICFSVRFLLHISFILWRKGRVVV